VDSLIAAAVYDHHSPEPCTGSTFLDLSVV